MRALFPILAALLAFSGSLRAQVVVKSGGAAASDGYYAARDYSALLSAKIFSFTPLANHFKLYQGYVKNTNLLIGRLKELEAAGATSTQEYSELKRRFGWEFNGMRLHELYFANLGPAVLPEGSGLKAALAAQYGSFEAWRTAFLAMTQVRGNGWAALVYDRQASTFHNIWINEHDGGVPAGAEFVLVMDLFEHAYMPEFQLDKARYAQVFWDAINWPEAEKRFLGK